MKIPSILQIIKRTRESAAEKRNQRDHEKAALNSRICPYCNGSGLDNNNPVNPLVGQPRSCMVCGGRGRVPL